MKTARDKLKELKKKSANDKKNFNREMKWMETIISEMILVIIIMTLLVVANAITEFSFSFWLLSVDFPQINIPVRRSNHFCLVAFDTPKWQKEKTKHEEKFNIHLNSFN